MLVIMFCNTFGIKTTRDDIISLVNEQFPKASQFTGATQAKSLTSSGLSISDFFMLLKIRIMKADTNFFSINW